MTNSQGNVREKSCQGKLFLVNIMFGATLVFLVFISILFLKVHFWHIALHYAVTTAVFRYCTVSMHDTGNLNMVNSAAKCQGNVREFHGAGEWSTRIQYQ